MERNQEQQAHRTQVQERHDIENAALERLRNERQAEIAALNVNTRERCTQFAQMCKTLQTFMSNRKTTPGPAASNSTSSAGPSTSTAAASEELPGAIVVEIRALVEQRPVSSILSTELYRRQLEEIIRVGGARALSNAARTVSSAASTASLAGSSVSSPAARPRQATPVSANITTPSPVEPRTVQRDSPATHATLAAAMGADIVAYHREQIRQEIDSLMHRGLVSQILHSEFSDTLSHLILTLPGHEVPLGGGGNHAQINSDDSISIISASAQAVPHSHTTAGLVRQVGDLRSEVNELKSMIRLLMDAQLETQRCIRQEVAPFMGQASSNTANPASVSMERFPASRQRGSCLICMSRPADMLVYRCGHQCMCHECSLQLQHYQHRPCCPVCRGRITDVLRVYAEDTNVSDGTQ